MKNLITGLGNPKIKELVRFRKKSGKTSDDIVLIEDKRELLRALDAGIKIKDVYICNDILENERDELNERISEAADEVFYLSKKVFLKVSYKKEPFGIIAKGVLERSSLNDIEDDEDIVLIAESVEKPGNLGALLRTADGAGVKTLILCNKITDYRNPNVVRASTGTVFTIKIIESDIIEAADFLRGRGFSVIAADPYSEIKYFENDMRSKTALAVGSEAFGISEKMKYAADILVNIPMKGNADSLNVNQAAAIILYEALRQRN